jgi:hypothetical protein
MASHFRAMCRMAPAAALVLSLGSVAVTPALAADDGQDNFFSAVLEMIGVDIGVSKGPDKAINYHERAPLVLPPKMELRQPLPPVTARTQAWPQDPELVKAKKDAELAKAPRSGSNPDRDTVSAANLRRPGTPGPNANASTGDCLEEHTCTTAEFWSMLKNAKKQETEKVELVPGQEPAREYLTEPPPGYRTPTKVVKATAEVPRDKGDEERSAEYFRKQKESQISPDVH